jgi:site-specific recombinase XerD
MARTKKPTLDALVEAFLTDLSNANRSRETCRAYATDLGQFTAFHAGAIDKVTPDILRAFAVQHAQLSASSRARKQASLSSFFIWACRQGWLDSNPMFMLERVRKSPALPRSLSRERVESILAVIPGPAKRDRLLFHLVFETGLRIGEALALHVEDFDLTRDNEHVVVTGKGKRQRTVLLDDRGLLKELRAYLKLMGYTNGPLFRAFKNGRGGSLRYQSIHLRWKKYCELAGVECTIHQLRHSHATEMVNDGVSLGTIRKRLGHTNIQTTLLYAETSDLTADAEIRAWRRRQERKR